MKINQFRASKEWVGGQLRPTSLFRSSFLQNLLVEKSIRTNAKPVLTGILSFVGAFHFSVGPVMRVPFKEAFPISDRGTATPVFTLKETKNISIEGIRGTLSPKN